MQKTDRSTGIEGPDHGKFGGRESLTPVFDNLNTYEVTMHVKAQSTAALDGDNATAGAS